jgi:predicted alpha/beta-hydrolase family hydrolase
MQSEQLTLDIDEQLRVSGLLLVPSGAWTCYVMAHGAGAGMHHSSMASVAVDLAASGVATLRFQFPFMERGGRRPDPPAVAHATIRAAAAEARRLAPDLPLIAGGRSFGGRMTSQAQALAPLSGVVALAFLAFPLHPAKRPSSERAAHLVDVHLPMLFLQGTKDALAELGHLEPVVRQLGARATLHLIDGADHSFHVPARSGRINGEVRREMIDAFVAWARRVCRHLDAS